MEMELVKFSVSENGSGYQKQSQEGISEAICGLKLKILFLLFYFRYFFLLLFELDTLRMLKDLSSFIVNSNNSVAYFQKKILTYEPSSLQIYL